jgi:hypothetical protein
MHFRLSLKKVQQYSVTKKSNIHTSLVFRILIKSLTAKVVNQIMGRQV